MFLFYALQQNISVQLHMAYVLHFRLVCPSCGSVYATVKQHKRSQRLCIVKIGIQSRKSRE